jgi:hypothetical protein
MIELQYGSNRNVRDSDGNGVSDLVEFRTKGRPCQDADCAQVGRDAYAICAGFSPVTQTDGKVSYSSSTNDGLNDCEKFVLGANRNSFNTNGNLIPDDFAFKSFLPIIAGSANSAFSDPFIDGMMNYNKLKLGLPISVSSKTLNDYTVRTTQLEPESSSDPSVSCYHLQVGNIALTSSNNRLKVMIVQNSAVIQDKPFMMSAEGSLSDNNATLTLLPGDFK